MSNSKEPTEGEKWYDERRAMYGELDEWEWAGKPDVDEDDPFWDLDEQECPACHGTGIEDGDLYDPDETPCLDCGGWGTI